VAFDCSSGSTFRFSGHLWVILTDPFGDAAEIIAAPFSSKKESSDTTVILKVGDHPFISRDTVIDYALCRIWSREKIAIRVTQRDFEARECVQGTILRTIQLGLINSPRTPRNIKKAYSQALTEKLNG